MSNPSAAQSAARNHKSVRDSIERAHDQGTRLQPIDDATLARLGDVGLWRILVEPYTSPYKGMIEVGGVPGVDEAKRILSSVGRILQIGEFAYQSKTAAGLDLSQAKLRAHVGEHWLFELYAGQEVKLVTGHHLRILNETDLLMRIHDPELVKNYL